MEVVVGETDATGGEGEGGDGVRVGEKNGWWGTRAKEIGNRTKFRNSQNVHSLSLIVQPTDSQRTAFWDRIGETTHKGQAVQVFIIYFLKISPS